MTEPAVLVDLADDVLTITLNRPERLNALNPPLLEQFDAAFGRADADTRAVVIRGNGRAFSAGHDLKWAAEQSDQIKSEAEVAAATDRLHEITRRIRSCPIPVITQVHGHAIGGGAEIALSGDLIVCATSAAFRFTETAVGLIVTNGFTAHLPRTAGSTVAKEVILLGESFSSAQARSWGLVNRVVGDDEVEAEVARLVVTLRTKSPNALRLTKQLLDRAWEGGPEDAMARETRASISASQHPDAREAASAFAEGRQPNFARLDAR